MKAPIMGTLSVKMLSDWHVGIGAGRPGELDRLVARDVDGLPCIPAKTLIGMWRDGCERIASGLDSGDVGDWCEWLAEIFGDEPNRRPRGPALAAPAEAALSLRPGRLTGMLCEALRSLPSTDDERREPARQRRERLRAGLTFAKPGVRIDPSTGRAREDFLRMEEMTRVGMTLVGPFELRATSRSGVPWTGKQRAAIEALLVAGASEIERIGGKRRRGAGRCRAQINGLMPFDDSLLKLLGEPAPDRPEAQETAPSVAVAPDAGEGWRGLPIAINLLTHVVAADATVGNVVESLDYVPGSLLLPVIAAALRAGGVDSAAEIAADNVIVLPATLEIHESRGLPVPFTLHVPKRADGLSGARNRLLEEESDEDPRTPRQAKREGYVVSAATGQRIPYRQVHLAVTTHGTIADQEQRPTQEVGGVFSYEGIPAGTRLRSEIRLRRGLADRLPAGWENGLSAARLGRSKKDDYGLVRLSATGPWQDLQQHDADRLGAQNGKQELLLWLLSDLLLRGDALRSRFDYAVLAAELARKLGIDPGRLCLGEPKKEGLLGADLRVRRYDGWQAQWGMPRPSLVGLRAGSCLRIKVSGEPISPERLAQIEAEGLGERRAEGFGQVRFNDPLLTEKAEGRDAEERRAAAESQTGPPGSRGIPKGTDEYETAALIERAAWRKTIAEAAVPLALDPGRRRAVFGLADDKPGPSQLGGLRSRLAALTRDKNADAGPALAWLARVKDNRADRWPQGCVDRLITLLSDQEEIWKELDVELRVEALTENGPQRLKDELWGEAVVAALGAAMRAHIFALRPQPGRGSGNA